MKYSYVPLLRGRQFDLLALQSILKINPTRIFPIIEPVKDSSTLIKTLRLWLKQNQPIGFILNSSVGTYPLITEKKHPVPKKLLENENFWEFAFFDSSYTPSYFTKTKHRGLICNNYHYLKTNLTYLETTPMDCIVLPKEARFLELVSRLTIPVIPWQDPFIHEGHLIDYQQHADECFTWDHYLGQLNPTWLGFSDYSIMGHYYSEFGSPQSAQALHLIYPAMDHALQIHHFVSFDDGHMGQQKEKFLDLLQQLRLFLSQQPDRSWYTPALKELLYRFEIEKNPGFGTVKKLLLAHHFELVEQQLVQSQIQF